VVTGVEPTLPRRWRPGGLVSSWRAPNVASRLPGTWPTRQQQSAPASPGTGTRGPRWSRSTLSGSPWRRAFLPAWACGSYCAFVLKKW